MSTSEPFTDSSLECTLLRRSRRSKFLTAMMAGPTAIIKDWPAQRKVQYGGVPILVGGFVACRVVVRSHLHIAFFFDRLCNAKTDTNERMCRTSFESLAFLSRKIRTT